MRAVLNCGGTKRFTDRAGRGRCWGHPLCSRQCSSDPPYAAEGITSLKIKYKSASPQKLVPRGTTSLVYYLWLAICYFYLLVLYSLLSKHLPMETVSPLKAGTIALSSVAQPLMKSKHMVRVPGKHQARQIKAGTRSHHPHCTGRSVFAGSESPASQAGLMTTRCMEEREGKTELAFWGGCSSHRMKPRFSNQMPPCLGAAGAPQCLFNVSSRYSLWPWAMHSSAKRSTHVSSGLLFHLLSHHLPEKWVLMNQQNEVVCCRGAVTGVTCGELNTGNKITGAV